MDYPNKMSMDYQDIYMDFNTSAINGSNLSDYYYIYDYDESVSNIPMEEFIPVALVYGLTLAIGVVGNFLVIFSIARYRRMQNVTNIFLTSLSSADLLLILICVPIKVSAVFSTQALPKSFYPEISSLQVVFSISYNHGYLLFTSFNYFFDQPLGQILMVHPNMI